MVNLVSMSSLWMALFGTEASMAVRGIKLDQDWICSAKPIDKVWEQFTTFIKSNIRQLWQDWDPGSLGWPSL